MRLFGRSFLLALVAVLPFASKSLGADLTVNSFLPYASQSTIVLSATGNINFTGGTLSLPAFPVGTSSGTLVVRAGGNINISINTIISAPQGWSISMVAGTNVDTPGSLQPGLGTVTLQGTGSIIANDGSISIAAGDSVSLGIGYIHTLAGGNISVSALSGSVNTGTRLTGFIFQAVPNMPYIVDPNAGGIGTLGGGDISISAGMNIVSVLPTGNSPTDAGTGAFGSEPGNLLLQAAGSVTGHYVMRNGTGTIQAGVNAGTLSNPLALSLIDGAWNVVATQDIYLQEIRNPNGVFNEAGSSAPPTHLFDYSTEANATLSAGNSVHLLGRTANLPRMAPGIGTSIKAIYPPTVSINAGAGGVILQDDVILYPSYDGQLNITTTGGGSLSGSVSGNALATLSLSDSSELQFVSAASYGPSDHAFFPIHVIDAVPVNLNISGDLKNVYLDFPKSATVTVGGDMTGARFDVQNISMSDVTSFNVAGTFSAGATPTNAGWNIGGPGAMMVSAHSMNLNGSTGIQSVGARNNVWVSPLTLSGANLAIAVSGDVDLQNSAIASLAGGNVGLNATGTIHVGSTNTAALNGTRGIFTTARADVNVIGGGDIVISGSRVAAYDGGEVSIISLGGNIDVSFPGSSQNLAAKVIGNPAQQTVLPVLGNGVIALTFPSSDELAGDITMTAAHDVLLGCGAVLQASLNGTVNSSAKVKIQSGNLISLLVTSNCTAIAGQGQITLLPGMPFESLGAQISPLAPAVVVGSSVQFTATPGGIPPFTYRWFRKGVLLPSETTSTLLVTDVGRNDAGGYTVEVSNQFGSLIKTAQLRVLVAQQLTAGLDQPDHTLRVFFGELDGSILTTDDIPNFEIQTSTNLVNWAAANLNISTNLDGRLSFQLPAAGLAQRGFYRVVSK